MFKSDEQAQNYFYSVAFYNRHCGEFVAAAFCYIQFINKIFGA
jgi:hypothetical protein